MFLVGMPTNGRQKAAKPIGALIDNSTPPAFVE